MTTPVGNTRTNPTHWVRHPEPQIGEDPKGQYIIVQPGNTPGDIALFLDKRGLKIPPGLQPYYFSQNDPSRPDPKKHQGNLPVGSKFYLPKADADAQVGAPLPKWLSKHATARPPPQLESPQPVPDSFAQGVGPTPPVAVGVDAQMPTLKKLVEGADDVPLGALQKALADDLAKLPAGVDREAVAAKVDEYLHAHHANMTSLGESQRTFYEKQLSMVAHLWAKDPSVLNDRNALWEQATAATNAALNR